jgi:hypothetical protein
VTVDVFNDRDFPNVITATATCPSGKHATGGAAKVMFRQVTSAFEVIDHEEPDGGVATTTTLTSFSGHKQVPARSTQGGSTFVRFIRVSAHCVDA